MDQGWVKLYRKIVGWRWWPDHNTTRLFTYLLVSANYKQSFWRNQVIERGQMLTGRNKLAAATGLTPMQIRRSLHLLRTTKEITIKTTKQFSIITICNYEQYQATTTEEEPTEQPASEPTDNQQTTTSKNIKKEKKERKSKKRTKNCFNPEGKQQYGSHKLVHLDDQQKKYARDFYTKRGFGNEDILEAVEILDAQFARNPQYRADNDNDELLLCGWVYREFLNRRAAESKLRTQQQWEDSAALRTFKDTQ